MKKLNLLIQLVLMIITTNSCSQSNNNKAMEIKQNPQITANNFVEEITKQVKHYEKEPIYFLRIQNSSSYINILVNDLIVFSEFKLSTF